MKEAMFYKKLANNKIECLLCPHKCKISKNKRGMCGVRENKEDKLVSLNYMHLISANMDPIEKKPLFHFLPGEKTLSVSCQGCNFSCEFCQNYSISQAKSDILGETSTPNGIVSLALRYNSPAISYTYTEPTVFFETVFDIAVVAKEQGLKNILVTNGFINVEPLKKIAPLIDAANIDLKSFSNDFYKKICGGKLQPVLDAIKLSHKLGIWIEITTLIIPGKNDSAEELSKIAAFISGINKNIPWHVSAFHPDYKMQDIENTSFEILELAYNIGKDAGLNYVYTGNLPDTAYESTYCPSCKKEVIKRIGFKIISNKLEKDKCGFCGKIISGIF